MKLDNHGRSIPTGSWVGSPTKLNLTVASDSVELELNTVYRVWSSVDAFVKFGQSGVTADTDDNPLSAGIDVIVATDELNYYLAAIVATGSGVLYVTKIDADQSPSPR